MGKIKTPHFEANKEDVAEIVLLPGDPLRAKFIAEQYLSNIEQYNLVRNMFGYTGFYKDVRVSVQGSGMGMSSLGIYVNELIDHFGVRKIIRVGSCGAYQENIKPNDLIIAQAACTDSRLNLKRFNFDTYAPIPDYETMSQLCAAAKKLGIDFHVGNILAAESFYELDEDKLSDWQKWPQYGVLAVEMESSELFTIAAKKKIKAATILGVSDNLVTKQQLSATERQTGFDKVFKVALESLLL